MRKAIAFIALMILVATLSACGNDVNVTNVVYDNETITSEVTTTDVASNPEMDVEYTSMYPSDLAQFRLPASGDTVVTLRTNYGDIALLMLPEAAPKAVENFIGHGESGYYDGVIFHRVIKDFMIQGGDPQGTGRGGESIWGKAFEDELNDSYFPVQGALAMANSGPATNGSQFFIVQNSEPSDQWVEGMANYGFDEQLIDAYAALGGTPHLFNRHTVFGQVVAGMDVVNIIANVETGEEDRPVEDVVIEEVVVTVIP